MDRIKWEAVSAFAASISAVATILVWIQLTIYKQQLRDDHERSRRENAVNFLLEWSKHLGRNASLTRKLVEQLDESQVQSLIDLRPFSIADGQMNLVLACLDMNPSVDKLSTNGGMIMLNENQVNIIKWQTITYLNRLEAILTAWRHNTADRDIIEEQFSSQVAPEKRMTMLENYRELDGGFNSFPAIAEFVETVSKKRKDKEDALKAEHRKEFRGKPAIQRKEPDP